MGAECKQDVAMGVALAWEQEKGEMGRPETENAKRERRKGR